MADLIPAWEDGTLRPVDKLDVHLRGLKHPAVSVFLTSGREVLIQRRALSKYHTPGLWANTCCTHPHWQENARVCAARRLEQELGLGGIVPDFRHRVEYRAEVGGDMTEHEVVDVFVSGVDRATELQPDPNEVAETRWIDIYELVAEVSRHPERFTPWLRVYLAEHLTRIFGKL